MFSYYTSLNWGLFKQYQGQTTVTGAKFPAFCHKCVGSYPPPTIAEKMQGMLPVV